MTNMHRAIPEEKHTEAYRLLLEMRDNCVKHADDQYDDPKREAKREALNIAITAMGRSVPPRWISVEERLPEERLCVSVYIQEDGGAYWIETAFRRDGKWRIQGEYVIDRNITHWMHLPEPPKEST